MTTQVIYFNIDTKTEFTPELLDSAAELTDSKIDICVDWAKLANAIANNDYDTKLLLVHISLLDKPGTTLNEVIDSLNLIASMIGNGIKLSTGIVIDKPCSHTMITALKKSQVNGIVPSHLTYGFDKCFETINALLRGEQAWNSLYIEPRVKATVRHPADYGIRLTSRQHDIMTLVSNRGLSNKKIAQVLNISESTVKVHISAILKAYGVRNRTQLALAGSVQGLHA